MVCLIMDYGGLTSDSLKTFASVALICCHLYTHSHSTTVHEIHEHLNGTILVKKDKADSCT